MTETTLKMNRYPLTDIMKFIMSLLVVGIHTEPFGFNIWLDRCFGIVTRLCVPFFFAAGAYFFFLKKRPLYRYIIRIGGLYLLWSVIYLPFDLKELGKMTAVEIIKRYLWTGNEHALWYLCGTVIGTVIVFALQKVLSDKQTFAVSVALLIAGCIISTWSPLFLKLFGVDFKNAELIIGTRNGLFYAPAYISLGMCIARGAFKKRSEKFYISGFAGAMVMLAAECLIFIVVLKTASSVLWLSVLPAVFFMFRFVINSKWQTESRIPSFLRKTSAMVFVCHNFFIILLEKYLSYALLFLCVSASSVLLSALIVKLSEKVKILRYLY